MKFFHKHRYKPISLIQGQHDPKNNDQYYSYTAAICCLCSCGKRNAEYYWPSGNKTTMVNIPPGCQQEVLDWLNAPRKSAEIVKLRVIK